MNHQNNPISAYSPNLDALVNQYGTIDTETLKVLQEQMEWLNTLFTVIKSSKSEADVHSLSSIGEYLSDLWANNHQTMSMSLKAQFQLSESKH